MDNTLDNTFESANRVYDKEGVCPTIPTCRGSDHQPKVIEETRCVGGLSEEKKSNGGTQHYQQDRVYKGDLALAQPANLPGGSYKYIVAMRGRNPENPTDRRAGLPTEQRLEARLDGLTNILTTVQKDNLIMEKENGFYNQAIMTAENNKAKSGDIIDAYNEKVITDGITPTITTRPEGKKTAILPCVEIKQATKDGSIKCKIGGCFDSSYPDSQTRRGRVQEDGDVTPALTAQSSDNINYIEPRINKVGQISSEGSQYGSVISESGLSVTLQAGTHGNCNSVIQNRYRIRKLTPRECWRLMGYTDEDFNKAQGAGVSNSQLYKQAGNAIVKQVLMALFLQMGIQGKKKWNEKKPAEIYGALNNYTNMGAIK